MVDVDKAVLANIKKQGENFEISVDCDKAIEYKEGKKISLDNVVAVNSIFKDVKKGLHASEHEMNKLFGTSDKYKVMEIIIKQGHIHLTAEHKRRQQEALTKQIIDIITRNSINPQTNTPHPRNRIENAMKEAKVNIDVNKSADQQIQDVLHALKPILPIRFETKEIELIIPAQYAGASYNILKNYSNVRKDEWRTDGSLYILIELPAGLQEEFFNKINNLTHGNVQSKIIK